MLARIQQIITLSLLAATAIWALAFEWAGRATWGWSGAAAILLGYALFLAFEFVLAARHADPSSPPATRTQWLLAWWGEVRSAPAVFGWRQPFRSKAEPDHLPADAMGRRGIVFVHGFFCNRGIWNPWMSRLRREGVPFNAVNLEPVFGSIDDYVPIIDRAVRRLQEATGLPPLVVAHSMGGLAARAWLRGSECAHRVHRVITIASPHHGTWLARFAVSCNARQMQQGHDWLAGLRLSETQAADPFSPDTPSNAMFTCFYSHCDNIVFPVSSATLPGANNRHVPATAHVHLVYHPAVYDEVRRWLEPST